MKKKLERDVKNKVIGGVCSGLANYLDMDVALVRVLFVIALLAFSAGFWIYLLLWVLMPASSTVTADATTTDAVVQETSDEAKNRKGSLFMGLVLIGLGVIGLVHRYIPEINWSTIWPVLLIALGLLLIVPHKEKKS